MIIVWLSLWKKNSYSKETSLLVSISLHLYLIHALPVGFKIQEAAQNIIAISPRLLLASLQDRDKTGLQVHI